MKNFLKFIFFGTLKTPSVQMVNLKTGEKKEMSVSGFNLQILLLGTFFGLPLFFKRLWGWAWLLFGLSTAQFVSFYLRLKKILSATTVEEYYAFRETDPLDDALTYGLTAVVVLLAFKANEWAVKRLLKKGWRFSDAADPLVQKAAKKWKISKRFLKPLKEEDTL